MKRIFLSSTFDDLESHRKKILDSLHSLKQIVEAMEYWGSSPDEPFSKCINKVIKSNIFVCIIGSRYGKTLDDGKSYTQHEYETALANGLDIFTYVIDEENHPVLLKHVEFGCGVEKLHRFKSMVSLKLRSKFSSPEDLAYKVIIDIINYLDDVGDNIRSALVDNGFESIQAWMGYTYGYSKSTIDLSKILMKKGNTFYFSNETTNSMVSAAYILECIASNDYSFLDDVITFHQQTFDIIKSFISTIHFDRKQLSKEILLCNNATKLRMLIIIAEISNSSECIESICLQAMDGNRYRQKINETGIPVTPFYDVIRNALNAIDIPSIDILKHFSEKAKKLSRWQAKKEFDRVIKRMKTPEC